MAFSLYLGRMRHGKSYSAVENVILPACKTGRPVYTNLDVKLGTIKDDFPQADIHKLDTERLAKDDEYLEQIPPGAIIVLDEVGLIFPGGQRVTDVSPARRSFITEHGHKTAVVGDEVVTQELVFLVQNASLLASWVRTLADQTFVVRKLSAVLGKSNRYAVDFYEGSVDISGRGDGTFLYTGFGDIRPEVYKYYRTNTKATSEAFGMAGLSRPSDSRGTVWNHPAIKLGLPGALLAVGCSVFILKGALAGEKSTADPVTADNQAAAGAVHRPNTAAVSVPANRLKGQQQAGEAVAASVDSGPSAGLSGVSKPVEPPISKIWKVVGLVGRVGAEVVLVEGHGGTIRMHTDDCERSKLGQWSCVLYGELATEFSGPRNSYLTVPHKTGAFLGG